MAYKAIIAAQKQPQSKRAHGEETDQPVPIRIAKAPKYGLLRILKVHIIKIKTWPIDADVWTNPRNQLQLLITMS